MSVNVHSLPCTPDKLAMSEMVETLFAFSSTGLIELAWTSPTSPHRLTGGRHYAFHQLEDLVDEAARLNSTPNRNVYVSAGIRKDATVIDRRAGDSDVESIAALKVDCDEPGSFGTAQQICAAMGIEPNFVMYTGHHPHPRGALWWVLETPANDLDRVRLIESGFVRKLGSDPSVVNSSRVMRLAGSVAWPLKEGRQLEMTGVETAADTRPRAYSLDEIEAALRAAGGMEKPAPTAQVLDFNPASANLDLESLARAARAPGRWHDNALRAVAHVVGRGLPADLTEDALTVAFTLPGYTFDQTRADLRPMIAGAAKKWAPQAQPASSDRDPFPIIALDDMVVADPPQWRINNLIPERGVGMLYGASGSFKSFIAIDMAMSIAYGQEWRGFKTTGAPVMYIAAEGTYGLVKRFLAWRMRRADGQQHQGLWLAPVAVNLLEKSSVALVNERLRAMPVMPRLVFLDTVARSFGGGDENSSQHMNAFVAAVDSIAHTINGFVMLVHHAGKDAEKGARGSSVLRAALDVEMRVSKEGIKGATITITKQKDAEEGAPIKLQMADVEVTHPKTGEVMTSLLPVLSDDQPIYQEPVGKLGKNERLIMSILDEGEATFGTVLKRSGLDNGTLGRTLKSLQNKNYALFDANFYRATSGVWKGE